MKLPIYLDHHATTPVDPEVVEAMLPFFTEKFGNVSSNHVFGREVRNDVETARQCLADLIKASAEEIIFTSGATESNNLAIKGVAEVCQDQGRHIITQKTEHSSVLSSCHYLENHGFKVTYLNVNECGEVSPDDVEQAIRRAQYDSDKGKTILISIMAANNEIGTLQPVDEIGKIAKKYDITFHVDAVQVVGHIPVDVKSWQADLVSMSAHKMYGPKGVGALYVSKECCPKICCCQIHGGGQEKGFRSGTLPVPLVVGFGKAAEIAGKFIAEESEQLVNLRKKLFNDLNQSIYVKLNGHPDKRLPGNVSLTFFEIDSELLLVGLRDIAVTSSSACSSKSTKPSHVLKAIGLSDDEAFATIRFGLGRKTSEEEIDYVVQRIKATVEKFSSKQKNVR